MKKRFVLLVVIVMAIGLAVPAAAQNEIYDNGPINGNVDAWNINFGFAVTDSFVASGGNQTVSGMALGAYLFFGDVLQSADVSITSQPFGGTTYFDQVVSFTQTNCVLNNFGDFNVCRETATFDGPSLQNGTYWLTLQNAVTQTGDPVYWDENSGVGCHSEGCPSLAEFSTGGTIPSESFTVYGSGTGSTPEPGSLLLFSSGVLTMASMLRRKLF
jgi:hypothetical protein